MPPRVSAIFQCGLRANHDGRTMVACELIQRAAILAGVPSLSVLLSLANMRLKLGQPSAALIAYRHTLSVADPTGRHAQMARRKTQEALLIGGHVIGPSLHTPLQLGTSDGGSFTRGASGGRGGDGTEEASGGRARIWLHWVEEEMARAAANWQAEAAQENEGPIDATSPVGGSASASEPASPSKPPPSSPALPPSGGSERSPSQRLVAASPPRPTLATRISTWSKGLHMVTSEDAYLNEEQLDLLERLLRDAMSPGGTSPSQPTLTPP